MGVMEQNKRSRISLGEDNNALTMLIIINAVVFVIVGFLKIFYYLSDTPQAEFYTGILNWLTLPANADILATRPWTLLSYMFTHESIWGLISTLLWLWAFGYILQDLAGNNKLIPIYLYGGFAGGLCFLAITYLLPASVQNTPAVYPLLGGGTAVMAIAIATTTLAPGYKLFPMLNGGIPLWLLTLVFVAIDYATVAGANTGTAIAHLAAAGMGFLFVYQLRKGRDLGAWMNDFYTWTNDLFNPDKKHRRKPVKEQHFYKATRRPFEKTPHFSQQKLDEILDKINQKGYSHLSEEEKEFLQKASKEDF